MIFGYDIIKGDNAQDKNKSMLLLYTMVYLLISWGRALKGLNYYVRFRRMDRQCHVGFRRTDREDVKKHGV
jgi:hypothetical protein